MNERRVGSAPGGTDTAMTGRPASEARVNSKKAQHSFSRRANDRAAATLAGDGSRWSRTVRGLRSEDNTDDE
jgi:hypothetical protein